MPVNISAFQFTAGLIFLTLRKAKIFIIYFTECKATALREMPTQSAYFNRFYLVLWELVTDCWSSHLFISF